METEPLLRFLRGLERHNDKAWFESHRETYQGLRSEFADLTQAVIDGIKGFDPELRTPTGRGSLFRIHRDLRFTKDKRPYKTQFSASITEAGRASSDEPGYYFQINHAGQVFQAGGVYAPDSATLGRIRRYIGTFPAKMRAVVDGADFKAAYGDLEGERLVRPPAGFSANDPMIHYLRLKSFVAGRTTSAGSLSGPALEAWLIAGFRAMHPLIRWLRYAVSD